MIRLFKRLQEPSEIRQLRQRIAEDPSPRAALELCRLLQRQGRADAALECAREGVERFPFSTELRDALRSTWKLVAGDQIRMLQARAREQRSVAVYRELIQDLLAYQEIDQAERVAQELVGIHPDAVEALVLQAGVVHARFQRDLVARDGALAVRAFERVLELEPGAIAAHLALAEIHARIGAVSKSLLHVYKVLDAEPDHPAAKRLYEELIKLPLERHEHGELLRLLEERETGSVPEGAEEPPADHALDASIMGGIEQLSLLAGVRRVAFHHRGRGYLAREGTRAPADDRAFLGLAVGFRRAASLSAKRMGIGAGCVADLSWGGGRLLAYLAGPTILMIELLDEDRLDPVREEGGNFLASCTRVVKEAARV